VKAKATVRLKFSSEKHLEMVTKALKPETKKPATSRSMVRIEKDGEFLVLKTVAGDTVALRAALNTYLRWINSAVKVSEILENIS
jgi:tRNA threonylcarbamoyladenosine modification (KEOPS) complex  Pcc1 subunit